MERRTFLYAPSKRGVLGMLALLVLAGVFVFLFAYLAMHAKPLNGRVAFVCWTVVFTVIAAVLSSLRNSVKRRGDPKAVELDALEAFIPRYSNDAGFFHVRYTDILGINEPKKSPDGRMLVVTTRQGESRLLPDLFSSEAQYAQFKRLLISRWKQHDEPDPPIRAAADAKTPDAPNPAEQSLLATIAKQREADPLIGAKFAGKEILSRLMNAMKNERGVHSPSLLCALGALAGYSCQASVRAQAISAGMGPDAPFQIAETKDGQKFYFGDALNQKLVEDKLSVWSLAAGAAQHAGAKTLPDIKPIFERTASTIGTPQFGVPMPIAGHPPGDLPLNYLRALWQPFLAAVTKLTGDPALWPIAYGLAIQEAIAFTKGSVPPELALTIVMEAAVPMSKVKL